MGFKVVYKGNNQHTIKSDDGFTTELEIILEEIYENGEIKQRIIKEELFSRNEEILIEKVVSSIELQTMLYCNIHRRYLATMDTNDVRQPMLMETWWGFFKISKDCPREEFYQVEKIIDANKKSIESKKNRLNGLIDSNNHSSLKWKPEKIEHVTNSFNNEIKDLENRNKQCLVMMEKLKTEYNL